ncbi:MAG: hypothetical protein ACKO6N_10395, partial [Myxococcota bacterium]
MTHTHGHQSTLSRTVYMAMLLFMSMGSDMASATAAPDIRSKGHVSDKASRVEAGQKLNKQQDEKSSVIDAEVQERLPLSPQGTLLLSFGMGNLFQGVGVQYQLMPTWAVQAQFGVMPEEDSLQLGISALTGLPMSSQPVSLRLVGYGGVGAYVGSVTREGGDVQTAFISPLVGVQAEALKLKYPLRVYGQLQGGLMVAKRADGVPV